MNDDIDFFTPPPEESKVKKIFSLLKKPWFIITFAVVIVLGTLTFSINRIMLALLHSRPAVVVPKLEGKGVMEGLRTVSEMDLSLQLEGTDFDESLPAGTILRQHPPSGMQVRAGRSIRVIVSKGGEVVFVPGIAGRPIAEAQSLLASDGLQMGAVSEIYSTDFSRGFVISQIPSSGTVVTRGALVDVEVSKGMPPAGLPLLPDFVGMTADEVRQWAGGVNASVKIREDAQAVGLSGSVVKQDPSPGQPLLEGQDVRITIVPLNASQSSRLTYQIPGDMGEVTVRIMARDNRGESQVYEGEHKGGSTVEVPIGVNATTRFRIYIDDLLKEERVVEPQ